MLVVQKESEVTAYDASNGNEYPGVADRWKLNLYQAGTWTLSREEIGAIGYEHTAYRLTCTTEQVGLDNDSIFQFTQEIESSRFGELNKGFSNAREMTLSWGFRSNKTGTYIVEIEDAENNWSISHSISYDIADVWEDYEWVIPEETQNELRLDSSTGMRVIFWLAAGSDYTDGPSLQTSWAATTTNKRAKGQLSLCEDDNNYVDFTDIQLELGNIKTQYERLSPREVRNLCQRYFEILGAYMTFGICEVANEVRVYDAPYRIAKRDVPEYSMDSATIYIPSANAITGISNTGGGRDETHRPEYDLSTAASLTVGTIYRCAINGLTFDAELY
jgi:hypothetical protein